MNNFDDTLDSEISLSIDKIIDEAIANAPDADWYEVLAKAESKKVTSIFSNRKKAYSYLSIAASIILVVIVSIMILNSVKSDDGIKTTDDKKKVTPTVPTLVTTSTEPTTTTTTLPGSATTKKASETNTTTTSTTAATKQNLESTITSASARDLPYDDQGFSTDSGQFIVDYTLSPENKALTFQVDFYITDKNTGITTVQTTTITRNQSSYVVLPTPVRYDANCQVYSFYAIINWSGNQEITTNTAWSYAPVSVCGPYK